MKSEYTNEQLNEILDSSDHFLILAKTSDRLHFVSSKQNWISDGNLLKAAFELVMQKLSESQN